MGRGEKERGRGKNEEREDRETEVIYNDCEHVFCRDKILKFSRKLQQILNAHFIPQIMVAKIKGTKELNQFEKMLKMNEVNHTV